MFFIKIPRDCEEPIELRTFEDVINRRLKASVKEIFC